MRSSNRAIGGFTILEMLIAIMIIGIVAGAALPLLGDWSRQAKDARFATNVATLQGAQTGYQLVHQAPLGWVLDTRQNPPVLVQYGLADSSGILAQLMHPTDVNGNVNVDPINPAAGPYVYGPYVDERSTLFPAALLLAQSTSGATFPTLPTLLVASDDQTFIALGVQTSFPPSSVPPSGHPLAAQSLIFTGPCLNEPNPPVSVSASPPGRTCGEECLLLKDDILRKLGNPSGKWTGGKVIVAVHLAPQDLGILQTTGTNHDVQFANCIGQVNCNGKPLINRTIGCGP